MLISRAVQGALLIAAGFLLAAGRPAVGQTAAVNPHGNLSAPCSACHRAEGWTPVRISAQFDHGKSGFPLTGAHAQANCRSCHRTLDFQGVPTTCATCHQDVHHGELGANCAQCHTVRSFIDQTTMVRNHQQTRFPLRGAHTTVDCRSCHQPTAQSQLRFVNRSTVCADCHLEQFRATTDPNHAAGGFPMDCEQCHATTVWQDARFNHDQTGFPLTGAHRAAFCKQCHADAVYHGKSSTCASCHQADYDGVSDPNHRQAGFATTCADCHTTTAWNPSSFDHSKTAFPLTGGHRPLACSACHADGAYQTKPTACVACHQKDFDLTSNPNHKGAGFPTDCTVCHNTVGWMGANFNHTQFFPINTGKHSAPCATCHTVPTDYKQMTCVVCHEHSQTSMDSHHSSVRGYSYSSSACYSCHPRGNN
ncbi:MAG: hypothetical protein ABJC74_15270 [Gemmatimonadota bacterium]